MSTPPATGTKPVWKTDEQGRTTFRLTGPLILWWAWVVFAVIPLLFLMQGPKGQPSGGAAA